MTDKNKGTVTVKQTGSPIRRHGDQKKHLIALGLGKMNQERTLVDSPSVRGLILKVSHLIQVIEG
jgi:large subunit ribosomal protein L30